MAKGKFITFEGCDGCGKSTQTKMLAEYLRAHGVETLTTREPGGGPISEKIRALILDANNKEMTDECEALLYAASRVQHLSDLVLPALESGKYVLCDRYFDSSFAYQSSARGLSRGFIESINAYAIENATPDCTVLIDLTAEDAFLRKHGADSSDRIEQAGLAFHQSVYQGFLDCARRDPKRFLVVNGKQGKDEIFKDILEGLKARALI